MCVCVSEGIPARLAPPVKSGPGGGTQRGLRPALGASTTFCFSATGRISCSFSHLFILSLFELSEHLKARFL